VSLSVQRTTGVPPVAPRTRHPAKQSVFAGPPPGSAEPIVVLVVEPPPLVVVDVVEPPLGGAVDVVVRPLQPASEPVIPLLFLGVGAASAKSLSSALGLVETRVRLCVPVLGVSVSSGPAPDGRAPVYSPYATQSI
jgi:hypothetical protein